MRVRCTAHVTYLDLIYLMIFGEVYKLWSSSLCNFLNSPVTSSLLGQNILLRSLFSNTLSLCSSLNVRDQVSRPYKTTGRIMVLYSYILTFKLLDSRKAKDWTEYQQAFSEFDLFFIFSWMQSWPVSILLKYLNFATSSNSKQLGTALTDQNFMHESILVRLHVGENTAS
jgi:hypothetical protein